MKVGGGSRQHEVARPGCAEMILAVDDAHQGLGIHAQLIAPVTVPVRGAALDDLIAEVLPGNMPMLEVFECCGLRSDVSNQSPKKLRRSGALDFMVANGLARSPSGVGRATAIPGGRGRAVSARDTASGSAE